MSRSRHKSWQDKRPGWTRRVVWYAPGSGHGETVRLMFTDPVGTTNRFYSSDAAAQRDYDRFRNGELDVTALFAEQGVQVAG